MRAEKINQIKHLADNLQANLFLNEGLARGYESEVLADFQVLCSWGISLIVATAEPIQADKTSVELPGGFVPAAMIVEQELIG